MYLALRVKYPTQRARCVAHSSLTRHEDTKMIFLSISIPQGRTISASDWMNSTTLAHALTVCCICSH